MTSLNTRKPSMKFVLLAAFSTSICSIFFTIFAVKGSIWKRTGKDATFFGAGLYKSNPSAIAAKYPMNIHPAPIMTAITWLTVISWNLASLGYLIYSFVVEKLYFKLTDSFYKLWILNWSATLTWTFLFDREDHVTCVMIVGFVAATAYCMQYVVCEAYDENYFYRRSENNKKGSRLQRFVVDGTGILCMWSSVAFCISLSYALAYNNYNTTFIKELKANECSEVGMMSMLSIFMFWVACDMMLCGNLFACVYSVYPSFSLAMIGLFLSNYDKTSGMTTNNSWCIFLSITSFCVALTRRRLKATLLKCIQDYSCC